MVKNVDEISSYFKITLVVIKKAVECGQPLFIIEIVLGDGREIRSRKVLMYPKSVWVECSLKTMSAGHWTEHKLNNKKAFPLRHRVSNTSRAAQYPVPCSCEGSTVCCLL
jgi:hypothetical protein